MSSACSEIVWPRGLLNFGILYSSPTPLYADNQSAIRLASNLVYHERTKHIEMDCYFIRDLLQYDVITLPHASNVQLDDIFTEAIHRAPHLFLVDKLLLHSLNQHQLEGECKTEHYSVS